jgi:hypothetical protein
MGFELTTLVVIGTDCKGSCKLARFGPVSFICCFYLTLYLQLFSFGTVFYIFSPNFYFLDFVLLYKTTL